MTLSKPGIRSRFNINIRLALTLLVATVILLGALQRAAGAQPADGDDFVISGQLVNIENQPVVEAHVAALDAATEEIVAETESQDDGTWSLEMAEPPQQPLTILIERPHYEPFSYQMTQRDLMQLAANGTFRLEEIGLSRRVSIGFWAAAAIFLAMLLTIALEKLHSTTAALAGLSAVFLVTFVGGQFNPDLYIFDFERALTYINWEVIFLLIGMMIIIAIIEHTGIFQWTAFQAYRLSGGRTWLLVLILMAITAVASALLDNFTTMLLMTPISLQIGLALGINPLALIIPEILASNVGGISTLIGTPTNILIGAYAGIGFSDFLINQTVGVLLALALMGAYVLFHYRQEWRKGGNTISPALYERLKKNAAIEEPGNLRRAGLVFVLVLAGFIIGEQYHVVPAVPALIGATILLIWLRPDVPAMIKAVDWTTLVFFMALFMVVGAIQEVGVISVVAQRVSRLVGDSLVLSIFVLVFGVGTLSTLVANIPLAASLLPVVEFLTGSVPGAHSKALYYALSMGAAMGGNGFLIGAEANLVTAGITEQAGTPISFGEFLRIGLPVTYLTLLAGFLWLMLWFVVIG
ncbi:MAG TPA: SLC13 family permease [Candidatus Sulfomarinibacteraceae bacterium]|nr:SLC13 family permease [Candidatus Sulfomarinibacteraceae bacterium]